MRCRRGALVALALCCASTLAAGTRVVTVREATGLSVAATASGDPFAFELLGRIWVADYQSGIGTAITPTDETHARPTISPDGKRLASEVLHEGLTHIAVMELDGTARRRVTFGTYDHRGPAWSPDNARLLFASNRSGDYGIWTAHVDSLALEQLTFQDGDEWDPAWHPDGSHIAYISGNAARSRLMIKAPGSEPQALLSENNPMFAPVWRPGGRVLTYVRPAGTGGQLRMLILSDPPITKPMTRNENVSPAPPRWLDEQTLIYAADGHLKVRSFGANTARARPFSAAVRTDAAATRVSKPPTPPVSDPDARRIIVRAGRLFDGRGTTYRSDQAVVIVGERIASVSNWSDIQPREADRVVNARGLTVLPGLIDLDTVEQDNLTRESSRAWLAAGVTTIRRASFEQPASGTPIDVSSAAPAIDRPTVFVALSGCDSEPAAQLSRFSTLPNRVTTVDACAGMNAGRIGALAAETRRLDVGLRATEPYPAILAGANELTLTPNARLGPGGVRRDLAPMVYGDVTALVAALDVSVVSSLQRAQTRHRRRLAQQLFRLIGAGGRVTVGSGAPRWAARGAGLHTELRWLAETGLQPFQLLKAATLDAARTIGLDHDLGTIEPGRVADLLFVAGDPLSDVDAIATPAAVLARGRLVLPGPAWRESEATAGSVGKLYN